MKVGAVKFCSAACAAAGGAACTGSHTSEGIHRMHISELRVTHQRPPWDRFRRRSRIRPLNRCQTNAKSRETKKVDLGIIFAGNYPDHTRRSMRSPRCLRMAQGHSPDAHRRGFRAGQTFGFFDLLGVRRNTMLHFGRRSTLLCWRWGPVDERHGIYSKSRV